MTLSNGFIKNNFFLKKIEIKMQNPNTMCQLSFPLTKLRYCSQYLN